MKRNVAIGLRIRPEKEIPNEVAWIFQAFIIFMAKLVDLRKLSKEFYKAGGFCDFGVFLIGLFSLVHFRKT